MKLLAAAALLVVLIDTACKILFLFYESDFYF